LEPSRKCESSGDGGNGPWEVATAQQLTKGRDAEPWPHHLRLVYRYTRSTHGLFRGLTDLKMAREENTNCGQSQKSGRVSLQKIPWGGGQRRWGKRGLFVSRVARQGVTARLNKREPSTCNQRDRQCRKRQPNQQHILGPGNTKKTQGGFERFKKGRSTGHNSKG